MQTTSYAPFMRVSPFAQMPNPDYYVINGATVTVEYGFVAGSDQLMFDYEGSFPINATYSSSNGVLYMTGVAPISAGRQQPSDHLRLRQQCDVCLQH